ncbi:hypothetical protein [Deinococcus gobiensis]|uniref:hypothetical protein n=1 Tax=Deinococcus gobiensis TaxID=502394 RepID=UPI0002DC9326|nr:hypothetical protein [Deinococcus gobiensis]
MSGARRVGRYAGPGLLAALALLSGCDRRDSQTRADFGRAAAQVLATAQATPTGCDELLSAAQLADLNAAGTHLACGRLTRSPAETRGRLDRAYAARQVTAWGDEEVASGAFAFGEGKGPELLVTITLLPEPEAVVLQAP